MEDATMRKEAEEWRKQREERAVGQTRETEGATRRGEREDLKKRKERRKHRKERRDGLEEEKLPESLHEVTQDPDADLEDGTLTWRQRRDAALQEVTQDPDADLEDGTLTWRERRDAALHEVTQDPNADLEDGTLTWRERREAASQFKPPPPQPGAYLIQGSFVERADLNTCSSKKEELEQQHDGEDMFADFISSRTTTRHDYVKEEEGEENNELVVAAQLSEDAEFQLEEKLRRSLLKDICQASVVQVTQPALSEDNSQSKPLDTSYNKHKNVKEKLFGRRVEVDIGATPEKYIRSRDFLPWKVQQNPTTKLWVASIQSCQKTEDPLEVERSIQKFVASTQDEAHELGLAMARPKMLPFDENPICYLCKVKFAVFWRPSHCRNCGVCICNSCATSWPSKMLPETYRTSKLAVSNVCLACDWLARGFRNALVEGNFYMALELYQTGNLNLRTPYMLEKKRAEVFYPIHMAILSGNLELVQWLASERCCPLRAAPTTRKKKSSLDNNNCGDTSIPLVTSKGRSPIHLALQHSRVEILRYLVAEKKLSLLEEVIEEADFKFVLHHLTCLLQVWPDSAIKSTVRESLVKKADPIVANVSVKAKARNTVQHYPTKQKEADPTVANVSVVQQYPTKQKGTASTVANISVEARARNIVQHHPTKQSLWLDDQEWDDEAENAISLENIFDGKLQQVKVSETLYRFMNANVSVEGTPFASCHSITPSTSSNDSMGSF